MNAFAAAKNKKQKATSRSISNITTPHDTTHQNVSITAAIN
jgi:hypothetical protein